jgi:hypothetical protein
MRQRAEVIRHARADPTQRDRAARAAHFGFRRHF